MKEYAVIEDCVVDTVDKSETKLFADKQHAEIVMRRSIEEEREDGCIRDWRSSEFFVEEQYNDLYFTAYFKNEYRFNHYTDYVKEMELALSVPFAKDTLSAICEANHQLSHQSKLPN